MKISHSVQRVIILALLVCGASSQALAQISKAVHTKLKGLIHEYWYDDWKSTTMNSNRIMYSNSMNLCDSIFSSSKMDINNDGIKDYVLLTSDSLMTLGNMFVLVSNKTANEWVIYHYDDAITGWGRGDIGYNNHIAVKKGYFYWQWEQQHREPHGYSRYYLYFKYYRRNIIKIREKEVFVVNKFGEQKYKSDKKISTKNFRNGTKSDFHIFGTVNF